MKRPQPNGLLFGVSLCHVAVREILRCRFLFVVVLSVAVALQKSLGVAEGNG